MKNYDSRFNHRITLRLSDEKYNFVLYMSKEYGMSPSKYIRLLIDTQFYSAEQIGGDPVENK